MFLQYIIDQAKQELKQGSDDYRTQAVNNILNDAMLTTHRDELNMTRFMDLVALHQQAFASTEEELKDLIKNMGDTRPWLAQYMQGNSYIQKSLETTRLRTNKDTNYIFYFETDAVGFRRGTEPGTVDFLHDLILTHVTEEASEVTKEICKNRRNIRKNSHALMGEMADLQAMIQLFLEHMPGVDKALFHEQVLLARNKKIVVIDSEY